MDMICVVSIAISRQPMTFAPFGHRFVAAA